MSIEPNIFKVTSLGSSILEPRIQELNTEYFIPGTICAVAADVQSSAPFFFVKIKDECYSECDIMDDYNNVIPAGHYLEKESWFTKRRHLLFHSHEKNSSFFIQTS